MKQESIEEAAEQFILKIDGTYNDVDDAFIGGAQFGAQWQEKRDDWIPIGDKSQEPVEGVRYDIYNKQGNILPAIYERGRFYRFIDFSSTDRFLSVFYTDVTHWQPLPNPPKS